MIDNSIEAKPEKGAKTQFVLTGFNQTAGVRTYAFDGVGDGRRIAYTVAVDLALIPRYGIRIQDLPLLCREVLQQPMEPNELSAFIFTEQGMRDHAEKLAIARELAQQKKKPRNFGGANPAAVGP